MCEYCTKEGFTKSIIDKGIGFSNYVQLDVGYSDGEIKDVPALCLCYPMGMFSAEIKYCPMCGKNISKEQK